MPWVLQVTPLVALAPLLMLWIETPWLMRVVCAWIVAFFPILANTVVGLRSADPGLERLFQLYHATPWQRVRLLLTPSALPYFLAGLKVSTNLALVGAVVAEFVTGAGTDYPGLASLVFEGQYQTKRTTDVRRACHDLAHRHRDVLRHAPCQSLATGQLARQPIGRGKR